MTQAQFNGNVMPQPGTLLFLCTGNYYRSRLSELLFRLHAEKQGLDWCVDSKAILTNVAHKGLSPSAIHYLEKKDLADLAAVPRHPEPAKLEDVLGAQLVVVLNRIEHEPLLKQRFGRIPAELEKTGRLRYWNVFDIPLNTGWSAIFSGRQSIGSQPETSGGEHIDFAVQALVSELLRQPVKTA